MKTSRSKYFLSCIILFASCYVKAQQNNDNSQSQAMIMVIGNPVQTDNSNDFVNTDPYPQSTTPPVQQQNSQAKTTIEPTLENGFHARFELGSSQSVDKMSSAPYFQSEENVGKTKKSFSFNTFRFNINKRIKAWLPKRKKKYRPHRCGRF